MAELPFAACLTLGIILIQAVIYGIPLWNNPRLLENIAIKHYRKQKNRLVPN